MVDKNDALFRELQEEVRREQFHKIWQKYGTYFILAAFALVAAVAGIQVWHSQRYAANNAAGADFEAAAALASSAKTEDALKAFSAISASGPKGYAALASLSEAGALLKLDKKAEALAIFDRLAADAAADRSLSNFARLQAGSLRVGEADFTEMENRLKPLMGEDSPWRLSAGEMLAMSAIKAGKLDEARTILQPLVASAGMNQGSSVRINRLMAQIASKELGSAASSAPAPATATPVPAQIEEKPASAP
jgi:hypothetical protein